MAGHVERTQFQLGTDQEQTLLTAAKAASKQAYCPYSQFAVGAAVLAKSGAIYKGCNVENASYGLTICAERNAIFQAVSKGHRPTDFIAVAIYTPTPKPATPCGACRQVIAEFGEEIQVVSGCAGEPPLRLSINDLLPHRFTLD